MSRLKPLDPATMTPEQRRVHDMIASGPRGQVQGPLLAWLQSPGLAERAQELGAFCRYGTCLPPRLSELAILVTAEHWRAPFEWYAHAPIAAKAGHSAENIEALRTGRTPAFAQEDERIVYDYARELLRTRGISDATGARAHRILGDTGVMDLIGILGYYGLISMTINAVKVPLPEGEKDPFAGLPSNLP